jgi:hypothetical protein
MGNYLAGPATVKMRRIKGCLIPYPGMVVCRRPVGHAAFIFLVSNSRP